MEHGAHGFDSSQTLPIWKEAKLQQYAGREYPERAVKRAFPTKHRGAQEWSKIEHWSWDDTEETKTH